MNKKSIIFSLLLAAAATACSRTNPAPETPQKILAGYTHSSATTPIDPAGYTHIIYSGAYINDSLNGIGITNPDRLRYVTSLKDSIPGLQIILSVGAPAENLSLMSRNDSLRQLTARDFMRVMEEYNLDGIDIDWEWPGRGEKALPLDEEIANYTSFLSDTRKAIGPDKLLTIAIATSCYGTDFEHMTPLLDWYNVMNYDLGKPPYSHNAPLYKSDLVTWTYGDEGVAKMLEAGVPSEKIVYGVAFYGHGTAPYKTCDWRDIELLPGMTAYTDSVACAAYIADSTGTMVYSYDTPYTLSQKCRYILDRNLGGAMVWRMESDDTTSTLSRSLTEALKQREKGGKLKVKSEK